MLYNIHYVKLTPPLPYYGGNDANIAILPLGYRYRQFFPKSDFKRTYIFFFHLF